ncbi:MAG: S1 RNA-binding domain-containing protein [Clostridia bacterium]|nr:S1 RNA-binding domain-containing protein [Clostridia bacterium]
MNMYAPEGMLISTPRNYEYISSPEGLSRALARGAILEAQAVLCDHRMNLHIELGAKIKGIIPREESQYLRADEEIKDIAILTRVGKPVCFKVMGFENGKNGERVAILSRRAAQRECAEVYLSALAPGDIIPTRITHLESFGAFVDVGCGISSLLSIDCISVSRIAHPSARMTVGDSIYTVVKSIDERGRIYVSQKELLGSWEENAGQFSEGEPVRGIVRSVESYGIFVELKPNLAGLAEYRADVYPGQTCAVYIKSIIPDRMKIKLIIIDAHDSREQEYSPPEYYVDTERVSHIDSWQYSPPGSRKVIETVF